MRTLRTACLTIASLVAGCGAGGDDTPYVPATCDDLCAHVLNDLPDKCGDPNVPDFQDDCVALCEDNLGVEFTQENLDCGAEADSCDALFACGGDFFKL